MSGEHRIFENTHIMHKRSVNLHIVQIFDRAPWCTHTDTAGAYHSMAYTGCSLATHTHFVGETRSMVARIRDVRAIEKHNLIIKRFYNCNHL